MRTRRLLALLLFEALVKALPWGTWGFLGRRELPQEHSHAETLIIVQEFLQKNNPDNIEDSVFGLLGNAAAAEGAGSLSDLDCLQQATADQAFSNAMDEDSVEGMVAALVYRTLERNTQGIGTRSELCASMTAKNPEIAALTQHQDPASDGAAEYNRAVALQLAVEIDGVGGDPRVAMKSGTFAPGDKSDNSGKGNTCELRGSDDEVMTNSAGDDASDKVGCIFTQQLLVPDVTSEEIDDAVARERAELGSLSEYPQEALGSDGMYATGDFYADDDLVDDDAYFEEYDDYFDDDFPDDECPAPPPPCEPKPAQGTPSQVTFLFAGQTRSAAPETTQSQSPSSRQTLASSSPTSAPSSTSTRSTTTSTSSTTSQSTTTASASAAQTPINGVVLGQCANADPSVEFGYGFDGRNTDSFRPVDNVNFDHGSATDIDTITSFICQRLSDKCKAPSQVVSACESGREAANGQTGQAAADVFNAAF